MTVKHPFLFQVCSTLSFSGSGVFHRMNRGFDVVVIDEAAQAVSNYSQRPISRLSFSLMHMIIRYMWCLFVYLLQIHAQNYIEPIMYFLLLL